MKKAICILGSARSNGNTRAVVNKIDPSGQFLLEDLNDLEISRYDYNHRNQKDDFIKLMERVIEHDVIVLATPVYWYAMSAQMKTFFDRLTDCVTIRQDLGKALEGKKVYLVASYSTPKLDGFEFPFQATCEYFKMEYMGAFFHYDRSDEKLKEANAGLGAFAQRIFADLAIEA